jgi:hypothetical protein
MSRLKAKIRKSQLWVSLSPTDLPTTPKSVTDEDGETSTTSPKVEMSSKKKKRSYDKGNTSQSKISEHDVKSTKNIIKNYGRAICNFILDPISLPYLEDIIRLDKEEVKLEDFIAYIAERKGNVTSMEKFQRILVAKDSDNKEEVAFKRIFKKVSEIFVKYFSVNWIYSGRMLYKRAHLDFRFKMLRRLRNPELFTYLK